MYSFYDYMQMGGMPQMKNGGDPDGEMAIGQIMAMHQKLSALQKFIQPDSDLEPWVASKLTLADDYLNSVADYMQYNPEESGEMQPDDESQEGLPMEQMRNGGYTVTRSNDRKGKTHKVTGPDGTVKYFGDSKLGQHPKDPERKAAFYARHKKNLDRNPYFRAFARATWKEGGETDLPKYQIDGWVQDAANGKFFCKAFGRPDMGGGSGGYYTTAKEAKPVSNFDYISNLDNDLWFGKDELKQVRKTRPKDVDEKVWNALNSDARWVTNDFTNKSRWPGDKINPKTGRLDDVYLADEWRPKINISNRYRHYNNIFRDKVGPVTAQDLYNYYSAQPGGWEAYKTLVNNDYMQKKKNGGSTFSGNAWYQVGGEPRMEDYPDYGSWKSAYDAYIMAGNSPEAAQAAVSPFEMAAMQQQAMAQNDMIESDIPGGGARPLPPELRGQPAPQQMPVAAQPAAKPSINYHGVSIVDLLGSVGKASDYNSRKQLAAELGIDNYYGSAQQNLEMIKRITKDPSVLNDYKTASAYKPKAKTASRSSGNKPKTIPSPVEQQAASMFTPEFFANQKKNYLAANPSISSEQYDAMFGPKQPTTFIGPSSKNLPANPERENNPYYYDDSYILNQIKNDPGTPGNIRKRKQKEFITDLAVGTLLPWLAESALMAATTRYLPYGLKALPEVSSAAQKYLPGIAKRLPAPGPANWVTNSGLAYEMGGDTPCYECGGMFAYGGYLPEQYAEGGISIDPKKRGTFKAQATRMGMSTQEAASAILNAPEGKYSPEMRRKANFARNFAKQKGGPVVGDVMDVSPEQLELLKAQGYDFEII